MRLCFLITLGCALLAGIAPAAATGTVACDAAGKGITFSIMGTVPHGSGDPLLQLRAQLTIGHGREARSVGFDDENLTQYWYDGKVLYLRLYRESEAGEPFVYSELSITARGNAEADGFYKGQYRLDSFAAGAEATVTRRGPVDCSAD